MAAPKKYWKMEDFAPGDKVIITKLGQNYSPSQGNPLFSQYKTVGIVHLTRYQGDRIVIDWPGSGYSTYSETDGCVIQFADATKNKINKKVDLTHLDRVVINPDLKREIVSVLKQMTKHKTIFEDWGLDEVMEYGKGMTFLFHGGPGTGKTYMAMNIAKALGTELLVISAAEIQTSEPGGANRNIQNAFEEAKTTGKVLLLDECDSLITLRSDVGMIMGGEINTLLTEIEKFEGVCVLTTNRVGTMDEALERRISLIVEFKDPNFEERKEIWTKILPKKMPLDKNVKVEQLAQFKLTGGKIKNVLLHAARLAVGDDCEQVELCHFERAIELNQASTGLMGKDSTYNRLIGKVKSDAVREEVIKI